METNHGGFLMSTFTDGRDDAEQIYFSISKDGLNWTDLNNGNPVIVSGLGTMGVRDPFLLRDVQRKRFCLLGTDLCIEHLQDWDAAQYKGSRYIKLWESENLVDWSEERLVEIGVPQAGCVWAPEAIYDVDRGEHMIYFSSMIKLPGEAEAKQRIYNVYTKDFEKFSEPQVYMDEPFHVIDMTIIRHEDRYYRFTKNETTKCIFMDAGDDLQGKFQRIETEALNRTFGLEGPACYYIPELGKWCLLAERFAEKKGYIPFLCTDLERGVLDAVSPGMYDMGGILKKHGSILSITREEYEKLSRTDWAGSLGVGHADGWHGKNSQEPWGS